jgi:uncharacterized protein YprB with RNaseH-like and TPR domain
MSSATGGPDSNVLDIDRAAASQIRKARLARLRAGIGTDAGRNTASSVAPPSRPDRAEALARDTGGTVLETSHRPVVLIEWRERLVADLAGLADLPEPVDAGQPLVLFDTETTGLGSGTGNVPFLVGVGTWQGDDFVTRQLLLPEQSDEAGYLSALETLIPPDACLVSYNGRTFDWPLLVTRYRMQGRTPPRYAAHLDLLPLARSLWRHRLADARLASVERAICDVVREHDLPGGLVPARYLDYLRSGHGGLLREVIEHNRQDVVSMALLLRVLAQDLTPASRAADTPRSVHPGDLGGLGRAYARKRRNDEALACFDEAMERLYDPREIQRYEGIAVDRARTLTRLGQRSEAEGAWHAIALEGGAHAALAWLHVAKHREHDGRDFKAALQATDRARSLVQRARLFGRRDRVVENDLARRVPRLRRRLAAAAA